MVKDLFLRTYVRTVPGWQSMKITDIASSGGVIRKGKL
jgi:hypothetical protein